MARSLGYSARGSARRRHGWADALTALKRRLFESLGFALLLSSFLLALALLTYDPRDPSLNTAVDASPHNFLGQNGAVLADLLRQSFGLGGFLIPMVLLGWSLRLLLNRPLKSIWLRGALLPVVLALGSLALSVLDAGLPVSGMKFGGAVGWALHRLVSSAGLSAAGLPISMAAAAIVGLLLLLIMGLSWRDWRQLGVGAGRVGAASGRGTIAAAGFADRRFRHWREARRAGGAAASGALGDGDPGARTGVTALPDRREPRLDRGMPGVAEGESERGGLIRFIAPRAKPLVSGRRADQERQPTLDLEPDERPILPSLDLLAKTQAVKAEAVDEDALEKNARLLETVLEDFGVRGQIVQVRPGPVVTLYELEPAPGIKASRIIGLADDIARSMSAISVRVAVVPGRNVIGIELPNRKAETVILRELLGSPTYENHPGRLALILGKDISGEPVLADLAKMPHLLIAGTTGSGKSVGINTMILSILYRLPPDRCKFIMVDPKMLELSVYDGIPHLLAPVVTDPRKAVLALKWTVREMENRYRKMSKLGVRTSMGSTQGSPRRRLRAKALSVRCKPVSIRKRVSRSSNPSPSTRASCR